MADNERTVVARLRYETDKRSLQSAQRDLDAMEKAFASVPAAIKRANPEVAALTRSLLDQQRAAIQAAAANRGTGAAAQTMAADIARTNTNLRGLVEGLQESAQTATTLARSADEATSSIQRLQRAASDDTLLGGGRQQAFRGFQQEQRLQSFAVRNVAGVLPGGAGEIGQAAIAAFDLLDTLPKLALSFDVLKRSVIDNIKAIGVGRAGLVGALAVAAFAITKLQESADAARTAALGQLDAAERAREIVATSSAEEIQAKRNAAAASLRIAEENERIAREFLFNFRQGIQDSFGPIGGAIAEFNKIVGTGSGELKAAEEAFDKATAATAAARVELGIFESAINATDFATRAAAEAERRLAEERQRNFDAITDTRVQTLLSARTIQTTEALQERITSLDYERRLLNDILATSNLSAESQQRYRDRLLEIETTIRTLSLPGLQREIAERERLAEVTRRANEAMRNMQQRAETIARAQVDAAKAGDDYRASLGKIATDARTKLAAAASDRTKALVEAEQSAAKARADAISARDSAIFEATRKAQVDREKLTIEHQKRLADIQRKYQLDEQTAIEDRDALALSRAQRARDEAVTEENNRYAEQNAAINANLQEQTRAIAMRYQEQTAQIAARLDEQRATISARYAEQVQTIQAAAAAARAAEQQSYQQRLAALAQSLQQQLNISTRAAMAALGIQQQYWQATLNIVQAAVNSVNQLRARALAMPASGVQFSSSVSRANPALIGGSRGMLAFDTGGYITRSGVAMVHEGEYIMNPRRGQAPFAPTFNINGLNRAAVVREVIGQLEQTLDAMGWQ